MRKGNVKNKDKETNEIEEVKVIDSNQVQDKEMTDINLNGEINQVEPSDEQCKQKNKNDKLKVIVLVAIIVLALLVTAGLLAYKYVNTNKQNVSNAGGNNDVNSEAKKESEDTKYLVSFTDMYTVNPLTITDKYYEKAKTKNQGSIDISYVEISGLQDKKLQDRINSEIKTNAYYYSDKTKAKQSYHSYTDVQGSFNNILSIYTYIYVYENEDTAFEEELYLNYDLTTGEQIKFLDLFASNTPMNSIIFDLEYKRLAWDTDINFDMSDKEWEQATNMDYRDTSEYEDIILRAINRFKNLDKDKIKFSVSPNAAHVRLGIGEGGEEVSYSIDLYKYIDYVTMYKKFLTDKVVFENIPKSKILVFNDTMGYIPEYYNIESDNLFMSVINYNDIEYMQEEEKELAKLYSQAAVDKKNKVMKQHNDKILEEVRKLAKNNKDKGYVARFMPYSSLDKYENEYGGEVLIYIYLDGSIEEMNIDYYKENAFRLLAKQSASPKVSIDEVLVGRIGYDNENVKSLLYNEDEENVVDLIGYYTLDGVLVAKSYEEMEAYLDKKYTKPEPELEPEVEITPELKLEVDIYKEEE